MAVMSCSCTPGLNANTPFSYPCEVLPKLILSRLPGWVSLTFGLLEVCRGSSCVNITGQRPTGSTYVAFLFAIEDATKVKILKSY